MPRISYITLTDAERDLLLRAGGQLNKRAAKLADTKAAGNAIHAALVLLSLCQRAAPGIQLTPAEQKAIADASDYLHDIAVVIEGDEDTRQIAKLSANLNALYRRVVGKRRPCAWKGAL